VEKSQNPKGLALFARSCVNIHRVTADDLWIQEATSILELLKGFSSINQGYSGHCWGYDHPWQNDTFFAPRYSPNAVVTANVAEAFLDAYEITGNCDFLDIATTTTDFIRDHLTHIDVGGGQLCCSYVSGNEWKVINVNAMIAALYARLFSIVGDEEFRERARAHMNWVVNQQTEDGAWYYSDPPEQSTIKHDNYHTGFVLDGLLRYERFTGDRQWQKTFKGGLEFYEKNLFIDNGAPKWESDKTYPFDSHSAAQGIITFSRCNRLGFAEKILNWTLDNLYLEKESRFMYQRHKHIIKQYTLMRWSQAWMTYAISEFLLRSEQN